MTKFKFSKWLSSTGGPLIVMSKNAASLWRGIDGSPSDYDLACQVSNYTEKLEVHNETVLVLGDEPLQTAIATSEEKTAIVRWKWAPSEIAVHHAMENLDFDNLICIEDIDIEWSDISLVIFDAAEKFCTGNSIKFKAGSKKNRILTLIHEPTPETSVLIHVIQSL